MKIPVIYQSLCFFQKVINLYFTAFLMRLHNKINIYEKQTSKMEISQSGNMVKYNKVTLFKMKMHRFKTSFLLKKIENHAFWKKLI